MKNDFTSGNKLNSARELVDELWELENGKKILNEKIEEAKKKIIRYAKNKGIGFLSGSTMSASVKEYTKVTFPVENRTKLVQLLKNKGIYEKFSMVSYPSVKAKVASREIDLDIQELAKKEQDFRISLKKYV